MKFSPAGIVVGVTLMTACTSVDNIRDGMSDTELTALFGVPDRRVTDTDTMRFLTMDARCPSEMSQIWVYERRLRDDIFVGLNAGRRVMCAWDATLIELID
jgi:hypothetical protein